MIGKLNKLTYLNINKNELDVSKNGSCVVGTNIYDYFKFIALLFYSCIFITFFLEDIL